MEDSERQKVAELLKEMRNESDAKESQSSSDVSRLKWMYKSSSDLVDREEYLLGKAIDKSFEVLSEAGNSEMCLGRTSEQSNVPKRLLEKTDSTEQVDIAKKILEDPLYAIKQKEMEARKKLLNNPVKLKQIKQMLLERSQKADSYKNQKKKKIKIKKLTPQELDFLILNMLNELTEKEKKKAFKEVFKSKSKKSKPSESSSSEEEIKNSKNKKVKRKKSVSSENSDSESDSSSTSSSSSSSDQSTKNRKRKNDDVAKKKSGKTLKKFRSSSSNSSEKYEKLKKRHRKSSSSSNSDNSSSSSSNEVRKKKKSREVAEKKSELGSSDKQKYKEKNMRDSVSHVSRGHGANLGKEKSSQRNNHIKHSYEAKYKSEKNYGLMMPDGSSPTARRKSPPRTTTYSKKVEAKPAYVPPPKVKPLSEKEKAKKLKEMMEDAKVRKADREKSLASHRKKESKEEEIKPYDDDFVRRQMSHMTSQGTMEERIKSNINNIQRSKSSMNSSFMRK